MEVLFWLIFMSVLSFMMFSVMSGGSREKVMLIISDLVGKVKSLFGK